MNFQACRGCYVIHAGILSPLCGLIGGFTLFRHQFEEHSGAVFKSRCINGYGGFSIAFCKRELRLA